MLFPLKQGLFLYRQRGLSLFSVIPPVTSRRPAAVETPSANCKKETANVKQTLLNHAITLYIISQCVCSSHSDLSPAMMPAGSNFPEFLYLIPITTARTPEDTEREKTLFCDTNSLTHGLL